jgi:hypothetical protein
MLCSYICAVEHRDGPEVKRFDAILITIILSVVITLLYNQVTTFQVYSV